MRTARRLGIPVATGFHTRFDAYAGAYGLGPLTPIVRYWLRRLHNASGATVGGFRSEPAEPQPGPVPSIDGLTISEFGRPPTPGEAGPEGSERERADDVEDEAGATPEDG